MQNTTKKIECNRCGICCLSGSCPEGIEDARTGVCKFLIVHANKKTSCQLVLERKNVAITIGQGCVLKQHPIIYSYYYENYNKLKEQLLSGMLTFIERYYEQSFDWLTWRNGSLLTVLGIKHRFESIMWNKEQIRKYAIGYCEADNIPCRPKVGYVAVMFDTNERNCNYWWTHLTKKEFLTCFPEVKDLKI
jgi:hypothetical protein